MHMFASPQVAMQDLSVIMMIAWTAEAQSERRHRRRSTYVASSDDSEESSDTIITIVVAMVTVITIIMACWCFFRETTESRLADAGDAHAIHDVPSYQSDGPPIYTQEEGDLPESRDVVARQKGS